MVVIDEWTIKVDDDETQRVQTNVIVTAWKYKSKYKSGNNLQKGF